VLLRGSYGTGFKVADLDSVISPISDAGVTSGKYACPVKAPDPRAADCAGTTQYALITGGNNLSGANGLKPEESKQYTVGMRIEPLNSLSLGFDLWNVKMTNQISHLLEGLVFTNPGAFNSLFSTVYDAGIGSNKLVTLLPYFNLAARTTRCGLGSLLPYQNGLRQPVVELDRYLHAEVGANAAGYRRQRQAGEQHRKQPRPL
jgi:iron complex outermembrane receptor protein